MKVTTTESQVTKLKQINYPTIEPVPGEVHRPLWSVMIPTYNGTKYLEQTLRSVLEQDPGSAQMQIEVVDDCSTKDDPEALVKDIGKGRISFFRQPQNLGLIGSWNACIQRSYGHWVHILHQDDIVLPNFYNCLRQATEIEQPLGAAFCRHILMDEDGHWQILSSLERRTPGVLTNWIERIAVIQLIQFPSIVVKRSVYEKLGGFCVEAHYASDWEMWKRISAREPVWFEPQILACYRMHSASETSRLVQTGSDIADLRRAIEISKLYLPTNSVRELSNRAREHYAFYALNTARQMLSKNNLTVAMIQIREALRCWLSFRVIISSLPLIKSLVKRWVEYNYIRSKR